MELISVIIPVYNAEKSIEKCITSILDGEYGNLEIIAINDGSIDSSGEILDKIAKKDQRLMVIHQKNSGVAKARNVGLDKASGKYIAFADADDYVEPTWLSHQMEGLKKYNADITVCHCYMEKNGVNVNSTEYYWEYYDNKGAIELYLGHKRMNGMLWNKLFKAELLRDIRLNESLYYCEDTQFLWQALKLANSLSITPYVDYHYIVTKGSLSLKITPNSIISPIKVYEQMLNDTLETYPEYVELAKKLLCDNITASTNKLFAHGITNDMKEAYKELRDACIRHGKGLSKYASCLKNRLTYKILYSGLKIPKFLYRLI